VGWT